MGHAHVSRHPAEAPEGVDGRGALQADVDLAAQAVHAALAAALDPAHTDAIAHLQAVGGRGPSADVDDLAWIDQKHSQ